MSEIKTAIGGSLIAIIIIAIICTNTIIGAGERGVRVTLGKVSPIALSEGVHFKIPVVQQIHKFDVKTQISNITTQVYTKDIQQAKLTYVLNYNLKPDFAPQMYKTVGKEYQTTVIMPIVEGIVKDVSGKWIANDLISNREAATTEIFNLLNKELDKRGIIVTAFSITDISYNSEFEKAVEEKVKAQQEALKAKNKTVQIEEEAKQKILSAEAEAKAIRIKADALKANKELVNLEALKVQQAAVNKWDGRLPNYMMGNSVPFINVSK